jgi:glutathione peroxidase
MDLYSIPFKDSAGNDRSLADYRGKAILIVNTATMCGLAPQLAELQALQKKYGEQGLVIIGFPSDQFNQEPETNESVAHVCAINFGVDFLIAEKMKLNGPEAHPLFVELKRLLPGSIFGSKIKWNFTKFLLARDGKAYKRYAPTTRPLSFEKDIIKVLG